MTDATGTTTYSYDNRNRLISKATPQGTLSYSYNLVGNILSVTSSNPEGVTLEFGYDLLNRLQQVKDNNQPTSQQVTSYSYDQVGNLSSVNLPNGVSTSYQYNNLNRLTNVTTTKASTTISSYAYTLGAAGNRLSVAELSGRLVNYSYDSIYRLTNETITGASNPTLNGAVDYVYDEVGNRVSRTSTLAAVPSQQAISVDDNDRLLSDTYDDNGSTTSADGYSYGYDYKHRIISVIGNGKTISIKYNAFGNRVEKSVTQNGQTVVTKYLVDTNNHTGYAQVVEEIQNGIVSRQYSYGLDLISQRQLIGSNYQVSYFGYDGHGSVRYLTDTSGAITDTYDYDAAGILINQTGSTPNNYLYAGEQYDHDLGLYFNRARYLDVNRGRFWSQDSFEGSSGEPLSLHKYLYGNGDPVNRIDPSGNRALIEKLVVVSTIIGIISNLAGFATHAERAFHARTNQEAIYEGSLAALDLTGLILAFSTGGTSGFFGPTSSLVSKGGQVLLNASSSAKFTLKELALVRGTSAITGLSVIFSTPYGSVPGGTAGAGGGGKKPPPTSTKWRATATEPEVGEVADYIEDLYPGHVIQINFHRGGVEIDIETANAIIEVKKGGSGFLRQVVRRITDPSVNPSGKPVIAYSKNLTHGSGPVNAAGGIAARDIDALLEIIKP